MTITSCLCCGSAELRFTPVLWKALVDEWQLAPHEAEYVNRQQGLHCAGCRANLRSMALGLAITRAFGFRGLLKDFVASPGAQGLAVLELNEAGNLTQYLRSMPGHALHTYPAVDMQRLPFADGSYDLVVHSDTLEHVPHPVRALPASRPVPRPGGVCAFTVPIVVGRLTRSREGLPPSYHGAATVDRTDYLVQTEYGSDAWTHVAAAGFGECRIFSVEYPAAQALVAVNDIG